ncbi:Brix domain-containing protein, partial [Fragariocoptes setiger]
MLRRQQRLRREYLYRKSLEDHKRIATESKEQIKKAVEGGEKIPKELRVGALSLQNAADIDQPEVDELITSYQDDEYRDAGIEDPKVIITTSRDPSAKLKIFAKEMKLIFPNSQRINRGNYEMKMLVESCKANEATDLVLLHETRGVPDGMVISHMPLGPTAYFQLSNTVLRHDIGNMGTMSEAYPHLIFHNMNSKLGLRVTSILKHLFPVPKADSKRIMTFANTEDHISFRHHTYKMVGGRVELAEVGPRFEMKLYDIKLSTVDMADTANSEWALRPYMNTSKKRKFLNDD